MNYAKLGGRVTTLMKTTWPESTWRCCKFRPESEEIKKTKTRSVFAAAKDELAAAKDEHAAANARRRISEKTSESWLRRGEERPLEPKFVILFLFHFSYPTFVGVID